MGIIASESSSDHWKVVFSWGKVRKGPNFWGPLLWSRFFGCFFRLNGSSGPMWSLWRSIFSKKFRFCSQVPNFTLGARFQAKSQIPNPGLGALRIPFPGRGEDHLVVTALKHQKGCARLMCKVCSLVGRTSLKGSLLFSLPEQLYIPTIGPDNPQYQTYNIITSKYNLHFY